MIALPTSPCEAARIDSSIAVLSSERRPLVDRAAAPRRPYLATRRPLHRRAGVISAHPRARAS